MSNGGRQEFSLLKKLKNEAIKNFKEAKDEIQKWNECKDIAIDELEKLKTKSFEKLSAEEFDELGWLDPKDPLEKQAFSEMLSRTRQEVQHGGEEVVLESATELELGDEYAKLQPGRRWTKELLGPHTGCHRCRRKACEYRIEIADAKTEGEANDSCYVWTVPRQSADEWVFTSTGGLWQLLESVRAGRLILVALSGSHHDNDIKQADISPQLLKFLPSHCRSKPLKFVPNEIYIKFRMRLALVESETTGSIMVEDVAIVSSEPIEPGQEAQLEYYRWLTFQRCPMFTQSKARMLRPTTNIRDDSEAPLSKALVTGNSKGKGSRPRKHSKKAKISDKKPSQAESFSGLEMDHDYLTSYSHEGIIAAFVLIANNFEQWVDAKEEIRVMIIGLGGGLLPVFISKHIPVTEIRVVEIDEKVAELAKSYFGFDENDIMKLQIANGLVAVKAIADGASPSNLHGGASPSTDSRVHFLVIDTDAEDPSDGTSCPAPEFLEDDFLEAARKALHPGGILIVNVLSTRRLYHVFSKAKLGRYFPEVHQIEIQKDVSVVLIAMARLRDPNEPSDSNMKNLAKFRETCTRFKPWDGGPDLTMLVNRLKKVGQ